MVHLQGLEMLYFCMCLFMISFIWIWCCITSLVIIATVSSSWISCNCKKLYCINTVSCFRGPYWCFIKWGNSFVLICTKMICNQMNWLFTFSLFFKMWTQSRGVGVGETIQTENLLYLGPYLPPCQVFCFALTSSSLEILTTCSIIELRLRKNRGHVTSQSNEMIRELELCIKFVHFTVTGKPYEYICCKHQDLWNALL